MLRYVVLFFRIVKDVLLDSAFDKCLDQQCDVPYDIH